MSQLYISRDVQKLNGFDLNDFDFGGKIKTKLNFWNDFDLIWFWDLKIPVILILICKNGSDLFDFDACALWNSYDFDFWNFWNLGYVFIIIKRQNVLNFFSRLLTLPAMCGYASEDSSWFVMQYTLQYTHHYFSDHDTNCLCICQTCNELVM